MRLVVSEFSTVDGVVQAPGGAEEDTDGGFAHGGWSMPYFDPEVMGPYISAALDASDALLFGRRTFQTMAAAWPGRAGDPFADRMNSIPKYVVSTTLDGDALGWDNATLLDGADAIGEVRRLLDRPGRDLQVMGCPTLVRTLVAADLVDEYRIMVSPVLVGGGKRALPEGGRRVDLELVSVEAAATGVLLCTYRRAGRRDGDGPAPG